MISGLTRRQKIIMTDSGPQGFLGELKRRNVFRVGAAYLLVAWLLLQIVDIIAPILALPDWFARTVFMLLLLGLPVALLFAWAFELTPDGIRRERDVDRNRSITAMTGRKLDFVIIGTLAVALAVSLYANFRGTDEQKEVTPLQSASGTVSIAVLPFVNRSASADDAFFVDGMHDDLLTQLSKLSAFKVISRTSVMQYRATDKNMRTIGEELGVGHLIEGGVQRAGNRIRINVQLIDARSEGHVWAETYDRELTTDNIFEIQENIAATITRALHATLSPDEQRRIAERPTDSLEAYEAYVIGRQKLSNRTNEDVDQSVQYFKRAVAADSEFAEAFASLAEAYMVRNSNGDLTVDEMLELARPAVERAALLEPNLGVVQNVLGGIAEYEGDFARAESHYRRAIELSPSFITAYHWLALLSEVHLGRRDEAIALYRKAIELDPVMMVMRANLSLTLMYTGRFEEARQLMRESFALDPDHVLAVSGVALLLEQPDGRRAEALRWHQRAAQLENRFRLYVAIAYRHLGDTDNARRWFESVADERPGSPEGLLARWGLAMLDEDRAAAASAARGMLEYSNDTMRWNLPLAVLRDDLIASGDIDGAIARYKTYFPALTGDSPIVNISNVDAAVDFALLMKLAGRDDAVESLTEQSAVILESRAPIVFVNAESGLERVSIASILEDREGAVAAMRAAIAGSYLVHVDAERLNRNFDFIRDDPEFLAIIDALNERVALERDKALAMEVAGELATDPSSLADFSFDLSF